MCRLAVPPRESSRFSDLQAKRDRLPGRRSWRDDAYSAGIPDAPVHRMQFPLKTGIGNMANASQDRAAFLATYNLPPDAIEKCGLSWELLDTIAGRYKEQRKALYSPAASLA